MATASRQLQFPQSDLDSAPNGPAPAEDDGQTLGAKVDGCRAETGPRGAGLIQIGHPEIEVRASSFCFRLASFCTHYYIDKTEKC